MKQITLLHKMTIAELMALCLRMHVVYFIIKGTVSITKVLVEDLKLIDTQINVLYV